MKICDMAAPVTGPCSLLLFSIYTGSNKLPSVWSGVCVAFPDLPWVTWVLLLSTLAKSAPNFANSPGCS